MEIGSVKSRIRTWPRWSLVISIRRPSQRVAQSDATPGSFASAKTAKERVNFYQKTEDEKLLRSMKISAQRKLEWLYEVHPFARKTMTRRQKKIFFALRGRPQTTEVMTLD